MTQTTTTVRDTMVQDTTPSWSAALERRWPSAIVAGMPVSDPTMALDVVDPSTGGLLASVPPASEQTVNAAVDAARAALAIWSSMTSNERDIALNALADAILRNADELVDLEAMNTGKPWRVAVGEVQSAARQLRYYGGAARSLEGRAAQEFVRGRTSIVRREPVGVIAQITPWNYPLVMAIWKIGPALAAGNTVVLKPSELTPLTTLRLGELAAQTMPAGVLNVVTGAGDPTGSTLTAHPGVDMLCVTGSVETGGKVLAAAAAGIKRSHVELGGNAPVIVFPDADLGAFATSMRTAAFWNSGQDCTAAARLIVHDDVYDEVIRGLVDEVSQLRVGDPGSAETDRSDMGPLISATHRARVAGLVSRAVDAGARVEYGGRSVDGPGFFFEPTVLSNVEQSSEIVQSEIFGPVVTVQRFHDDGEALALANGVDVGLSASVWTNHAARGIWFANHLETGVVWLNDHLTIADETPHGGRKRSGFGKDLSGYAIEEYTVVKHIMIRSDWQGGPRA